VKFSLHTITVHQFIVPFTVQGEAEEREALIEIPELGLGKLTLGELEQTAGRIVLDSERWAGRAVTISNAPEYQERRREVRPSWDLPLALR